MTIMLPEVGVVFGGMFGYEIFRGRIIHGALATLPPWPTP